ncbi:hypothetical protein C1645_863880 [Glomus cerebriforme]|uniref:Serine-threonine/tyrosine-protein kinase catalytic domain-containing protein n=1 Tax=Glomus cerebriforme TaxID=658196 RepID=A0A397SAK0_9GLOM|nr:hypothetical protein C1645_863880 [Glomus cerebriforme]
MRPKIMPGTPLKYKKLMEQCWDADPSKRPDIDYLEREFADMIKSYYQNGNNNELQMNDDIHITNYYTNSSSIYSIVRNFSKVHIFEDLPEPRNATEAFHSNDSTQHNLSIPNNIVFEQSEHQIEQNDSIIVDNKNEVKGKSKRIYFDEDEKEDLTDNNKSKKIKSNNYKVEFSYTQRNYIANDDIEDEEISNNPNLHSDDQDKLEIPEEYLSMDIKVWIYLFTDIIQLK